MMIIFQFKNLVRVQSLVLSLGFAFFLISCTPHPNAAMTGGNQSSADSQVKGSSVLESHGDDTRCKDIYPEVYETLQPMMKSVASLWDESGDVKSKVTNLVARELLKRTRQMFLNIMGMRARPIHPIAFFAVVKDFESSADMKWSGGYGSAAGPRAFSFSTGNCSSGRCLGLFQIDLGIENVPYTLHKQDGNVYLTKSRAGLEISDFFAEVCGPSGLNILGQKGSLDLCASLYWWLIPGGNGKCAQLPKDWDGKGDNPCLDGDGRENGVYPWTPDTFAYAHEYAYVQSNQLSFWGDDPWKKLYEGGTAYSRAAVSHLLGYEHCAARYFLEERVPGAQRVVVRATSPELGASLEKIEKYGWARPAGMESERVGSTKNLKRYSVKEIKAGDPITLNTEEGQALMRAVVADFAHEINLKPWWYDEWVKVLAPPPTEPKPKETWQGKAQQMKNRRQ